MLSYVTVTESVRSTPPGQSPEAHTMLPRARIASNHSECGAGMPRQAGHPDGIEPKRRQRGTGRFRPEDQDCSIRRALQDPARLAANPAEPQHFLRSERF